MKSAAPKFNRLNPLEGIKKMFSIRGIVELLKSLAKIIVLGYIIWIQFRDQFFTFPRLMDMTPIQGMVFTGEMILSIAQTAAIIMVFVAAADYLYQWWDYEKNLRMSKQELKEEYKQTEGDPQVKGKIRERQQAQARQRMMQQVPGADVVIRNPTHYAVAIRYDPEKNNAPIVVAKGADSLALWQWLRRVAYSPLKTNRWPVGSMRRWTWTGRFPTGSTSLWQRCWRLSTA